MSNSPFFSIILPVYNGEKYISESIESVLNQSEPDFELIVIDDCSKDTTPKILESYQRHSNVKILRNEYNLNIAASLNRGIEEAKGRWMVRLDADDLFSPNYLAILKSWIKEYKDDPSLFFSSWVSIIDETGNKILDVELPEPETIEKMMKIENFLYHPATSFSKEAWRRVGGYPTRDRTVAEDTAMWLKFFEANIKLVIIPRELVYYRVHNSNITSINDARLFQSWDTKERKALRQYREWRISLFLKQKKLKNARRELDNLWSAQKNFSPKNLQYYLLTFMPDPIVHTFMWKIRPRLRSWIKNLTGRHVRV